MLIILARKNEGKRFEEDFKNSIPNDMFIYRLNDNVGAWGGGNKTSFSSSNICDYILYQYPTLILLELKSFKGKSIPLSNIRENQLKGLQDSSDFKGVIAGFIFNCRTVGETYFLTSEQVIYFVKNNTRKSIPISYLRNNGIKIEQTLKRVRYTYNIADFVSDLKQYKAY